jgi:alkaline phosphatase
MKTIIKLLFISIIFVGQLSAKPQNIILIIGDGMGFAQAYAGLTWNGGKSSLERAQYIGLSKTYSANDYVTDSGAGGTAIAIGQKANNKSIGIDKDSMPHKSLIDIAIEQKKSTAVIVTAAITHATPAAFLAHNNCRYNEEEIAEDIVKSKANILIGGGEKFFTDRKDKKNILHKMRNNNFHILRASNFDKNKTLKEMKATHSKYMIFTDLADPAKYEDGRGDVLVDGFNYASKAFDKNENGFFMMIESSQIDWACHNKDRSYLKGEMQEFEDLVKTVFDYADANPNTLVIITADHETGGLTLEDGDFKTGKIDTDFGSFEHTGVWVPVYTYGKNAENFTGIYENTEIFYKIKELLED